MGMPASIVMPLLKQNDSWLELSVRSALGQTVECEVLVVTSRETPQSNHAILQRFADRGSRLRVVECPPTKRFAGALNSGIRLAASDRIGFLLSDDWLEPRAVERCLSCHADIVSTSKTFYAADGTTELREIGGIRTAAQYARLKDNAERAEFLSHFLFFRRAALEQAGGVDETLGDSPGVDDFDLIWTLLDRGASVAIVEESLYNMRDHEDERLTKRSVDEMFATFNRILDKHNVWPVRRKALLRHHSLWFGRSLWSVYQEIAPLGTPRLLRPLQKLYRNAVPFRTRLAIHRRLTRPSSLTSKRGDPAT
jgi:glycosyltransferase involved in cell wall biosynthesis